MDKEASIKLYFKSKLFVLPTLIYVLSGSYVVFKKKFLNQGQVNKRYFKKENNKIYFDLKGYIFQQLKNMQIALEKIQGLF